MPGSNLVKQIDFALMWQKDCWKKRLNWNIETLISTCIDTGGRINKVLNNAPENAGDKQKQKKKSWENQYQVRFQLPLYKISPNQQLLILKLNYQRENYLQNTTITIRNLRFSFWTIQNVTGHDHVFHAN